MLDGGPPLARIEWPAWPRDHGPRGLAGNGLLPSEPNGRLTSPVGRGHIRQVLHAVVRPGDAGRTRQAFVVGVQPGQPTSMVVAETQDLSALCQGARTCATTSGSIDGLSVSPLPLGNARATTEGSKLHADHPRSPRFPGNSPLMFCPPPAYPYSDVTKPDKRHIRLPIQVSGPLFRIGPCDAKRCRAIVRTPS